MGAGLKRPNLPGAGIFWIVLTVGGDLPHGPNSTKITEQHDCSWLWVLLSLLLHVIITTSICHAQFTVGHLRLTMYDLL